MTQVGVDLVVVALALLVVVDGCDFWPWDPPRTGRPQNPVSCRAKASERLRTRVSRAKTVRKSVVRL